MSGGIAYVYDDGGTFPSLVNQEMVDLTDPLDDEDVETLKRLLTNHADLTGSTKAREVLDNWAKESRYFVKVMPTDYRRVVQEMKKLQPTGVQPAKH
jgi:glutamate synthase domain-containing protein 3